MLRIVRKVRPFIGVSRLIVKLFATVSVSNVAPAFGPHAMIIFVKGRDSGMVPLRRRIRQQRPQAWPLCMSRNRNIGQVAQRWEDAHEVDRPIADSARFGHSGSNPDERCAGGFFPQRKFPPMFLLAKMPAVIAPENNDGVLAVGGF